MPVVNQTYAVNSIVLPNAGTYIIQGQETLIVESVAVVCNLAASPVPLRSLPPKGLTTSVMGPFKDETLGTIPIFGYYSTATAGITITLWCTPTNGYGYAWASATNGLTDTNLSGSTLTALQVQ
jgi:hypothetical protein